MGPGEAEAGFFEARLQVFLNGLRGTRRYSKVLSCGDGSARWRPGNLPLLRHPLTGACFHTSSGHDEAPLLAMNGGGSDPFSKHSPFAFEKKNPPTTFFCRAF